MCVCVLSMCCVCFEQKAIVRLPVIEQPALAPEGMCVPFFVCFLVRYDAQSREKKTCL